MGRFQIAADSGRGYEITIYIETEGDLVLNIPITLQNVSKISGTNDYQVPIGHIPNEYQVAVIDRNNALYNALDAAGRENSIINIKKDGQDVLEGNITPGVDGYGFTNDTSSLALICDDGLVNLRDQDVKEFYSQKKVLSHFFEELLHATGHVFDVKIAIGTLVPFAAGTGYKKADNHRFKVDAMYRGEDGFNKYDLLSRLCEDFELHVFQEDKTWWVLDFYERASGLNEIYNVSTGQIEPVYLTRDFENTDYRQHQEEPHLIRLKKPASVITSNPINDDAKKIKNSSFEIWSEGDNYPVNWLFEDSSRFERSAYSDFNPSGLKVSQTGLIVYQMIPSAVALGSGLSINIKVKFKTKDLSPGELGDDPLEVYLARLRAFGAADIRGWNGSNFTITNNGYISRTVNQQGQELEIIIDEKIEFAPARTTILLEVLFYMGGPNQSSIYQLDELPIYDIASVKFDDAIEENIQYAYNSDNNREALNRNAYLSEKRKYFYISDIEFYDGAEWVEARGDWGQNGFDERVEALNNRRIELYDRDLKVLKTDISVKNDYKLYNQLHIDVLGEFRNFIPLKISGSVNNVSKNKIFLIECEKQPSQNLSSVSYR